MSSPNPSKKSTKKRRARRQLLDALDALRWKWPVGWKVDPPAAGPGGQEDWKLDMEIAEMLAETEQRRNPTKA